MCQMLKLIYQAHILIPFPTFDKLKNPFYEKVFHPRQHCLHVCFGFLQQFRQVFDLHWLGQRIECLRKRHHRYQQRYLGTVCSWSEHRRYIFWRNLLRKLSCCNAIKRGFGPFFYAHSSAEICLTPTLNRIWFVVPYLFFKYLS